MHKKEDLRISAMISFWQYYFGSSKPANFKIFKISRKSSYLEEDIQEGLLPEL